MENSTTDQKNKALFFNLVITFQQAAFQHMGKIQSPITGSIERDLGQARMAIDMLEMLKLRTKGNLADEETRMLDHVLRELRLNFVDELDKDKKAAQASTPSEQGGTDNVATQVVDDTSAQEKT
jgi:hypothetical protein